MTDDSNTNIMGEPEQQKGNNQFDGQDGNTFNMMNGFGNDFSMNPMMGMNPMMAMPGAMPNMMGKSDLSPDAAAMLTRWIGMGNMMMNTPQAVMQMMFQSGGMTNGMGMNGMNGMNVGQMGFDGGFGNWGMPNGMGNMNMSGDYGNGYYPGPRNNRGSFGRGRGARNEYFQRNRFRGSQSGPQGFGREAGRRSSFYGHQSNGYSEDPNQATNVHAKEVPRAAANQGKQEVADEGAENSAKDDMGRDILKKYSMREYAAKKEGKTPTEDAPANESNVDPPVNDAEMDSRPQNDVDPDARPLQADGDTNDADMSRDEQLTQQVSSQSYQDSAGAIDLGPNVPQGPAAQYTPANDTRGRGRGFHRGYRGGSFDAGRGGRGRGSIHSIATVMTPVEPPGVGVVGAPTGPKALREGGPNIGFRGRANTLINTRGGRGAPFAGRNAVVTPTAA